VRKLELDAREEREAAEEEYWEGDPMMRGEGLKSKKLMADLPTSIGWDEGRKVDDASGDSSDPERTISTRSSLSSSSRAKGSSSSIASFAWNPNDEEAASRGQRI